MVCGGICRFRVRARCAAVAAPKRAACHTRDDRMRCKRALPWQRAPRSETRTTIFSNAQTNRFRDKTYDINARRRHACRRSSPRSPDSDRHDADTGTTYGQRVPPAHDCLKDGGGQGKPRTRKARRAHLRGASVEVPRTGRYRRRLLRARVADDAARAAQLASNAARARRPGCAGAIRRRYNSVADDGFQTHCRSNVIGLITFTLKNITAHGSAASHILAAEGASVPIFDKPRTSAMSISSSFTWRRRS